MMQVIVNPDQFYGYMEQYDSIFFSGGDDGENSFWCSVNSAVVGADFKYADAGRWIFFHHMAEC